LSQFLTDMEGYFTGGMHGSNFADAFLGSYSETWSATPTSGTFLDTA
jgi:hypothetical protein